MKHSTFLLTAIIAFLTISSCRKDKTKKTDPECMAYGDNIIVKLKYGKTVDFSNCSNNPDKIGFSKLVSESRCPDGVFCIWPGTAHIRININNSETADTLEFGVPKSILVNAVPFTLKLESLSPYPSIFVGLTLESYEATISIKK